MCLGDLAQVVGLPAPGTARVRTGGRLVTVSLLTLKEPVAVGDWLQVHSGFALAHLTDEERRDAESVRHAPHAPHLPHEEERR